MKKYSGGYVKKKLNFIISGIPSFVLIDKQVKGVLCVLKNIIFRGSPTSPSKYIESKITLWDASVKDEKTIHLFRIQIALLELMMNGNIKFDGSQYKIGIKNNGLFDSNDAQIALDDLFLWLKQLIILANISVMMPNILLTDSSTGVDFFIVSDISKSLFQSNKGCIFIRDDEYDYPTELIKYEEHYSNNFKNYYNVEINDFRFDNVDYNRKEHADALRFILLNTFGYEDFRPKQLEIISAALNPKTSVLGLLPTGSGKSICFQIVSLLTPAVTLVVSPLTVLMKDQCLDLRASGINNIEYTCAEEIELDETKKVMRSDIINDMLKQNKLKMLYISPERIFNKKFIEVSHGISNNIGHLVIDEVHCLSEWGHDFRVSYLLLLNYFNKLKDNSNTILMGTSATASSKVIKDIKVEFGRIHQNIIVVRSDSIKRPELRFNVLRTNGALNKDKLVLGASRLSILNDEKSLFFTAYKNEAIKKCNTIRKEFGNAVDYYVGADEDTKHKSLALEKYKNNDTNIMVATKAFGMGVNIPDIRSTYHTQFASSVEAMYQEMGRAGRDGIESTCSVIFDTSNRDKILHIFDLQTEKALIQIKNGRDFGELSEQFFLISKTNFTLEQEASIILGINNFLKVNSKKSKSFSSNTRVEIKQKDDTKKQVTLYQHLNDCVGIKDIIYVKPKPGEAPDWEAFWGKFYNIVDKALYKLYLLGIIDIWSIDYSKGLSEPVYSNINYHTDVSKEDLEKKLIEYVRRYDLDYSFTIDSDDKKKYKIKAIKELCRWSFENFFASRWNSLKTLYGLVNNFKTSEDFANRIDDYFGTNVKLDSCVEHPHNINYMYGVLKETDDFESLKLNIEKYFDDNTYGETLNYLYLISCIRTNDMNNPHNPKKLVQKSLDDMSRINLSKLYDIFGRTMKYLSTDKEKEILSYVIYKYVSTSHEQELSVVQRRKMKMYVLLYELNERMIENGESRS